MFRKEVTILMLMLSVLPACPLKMGYKKVGTACLMYNDVFYTEHARSKIECSSICENNKFGLCSRFMYDSSRNMCLLHSDTTIKGRNSVAIQTNETWDFYGIAHEGKCCSQTKNHIFVRKKKVANIEGAMLTVLFCKLLIK